MALYIRQKLDSATLESLSNFICGDDGSKYPIYRSSSYLTLFFENIGINVVHDGSTRKWWVLEVLKQLSIDNIEKVVLRLIDIREYKGDRESLSNAVEAMKDIMLMENLKVSFRGKDPILIPLDPSEEPILGVVGNEQEFLQKEFKVEDLSIFGLNNELGEIINFRIVEINKTESVKASLSSIFLAGSTLEGLLLHVATQFASVFVGASAAPKDRTTGKVLDITKWSLASLVDVSHELGFLGLDVKKFSHVLRDFRNYIHPFQQMSEKFSPDEHTSGICTQILKAAVADLVKAVNSHKS